MDYSERLHISGFGAPEYDSKLLDRLVLKQDTKNLITDLVRMFNRDKVTLPPSTPAAQFRGSFGKLTDVYKIPAKLGVEPTWTADFLAGKGEGLTFLLHGKPGVGKTHTAGKEIWCSNKGETYLRGMQSVLHITPSDLCSP